MRRKRTDAYGSATEGALDTYGGVGGRSRPVPTSGIRLGRQRQPVNSPILRGEVRASNVTSGRRIGFNKVIQGTGKQRGKSSKIDISGETQTAYKGSPESFGPKIDPVRVWMRFGKGVGARVTSFTAISAGSATALSKKEKENKKKRIGRTILMP